MGLVALCPLQGFKVVVTHICSKYPTGSPIPTLPPAGGPNSPKVSSAAAETHRIKLRRRCAHARAPLPHHPPPPPLPPQVYSLKWGLPMQATSLAMKCGDILVLTWTPGTGPHHVYAGGWATEVPRPAPATCHRQATGRAAGPL